MVALIKDNPDLFEAIVKFNELKGVVWTERKKRFSDLPEAALIKTSE